MNINTSSMNAHTSWLNNKANNIANTNTKNYDATQTALHEKGTDQIEAAGKKSGKETNLTKELTEQIPIEKGFSAQAQAIKTENEMMGGLLNILA